MIAPQRASAAVEVGAASCASWAAEPLAGSSEEPTPEPALATMTKCFH